MNVYGAEVGELSVSDEKRLSSVAQKATSRVLSSWKCTVEEASRLLSVSEDHWANIAEGDFHRALDQEQLLRASLLVNIYTGLQVFSEDTARAWPKLPNTGPLFSGKSPVEFMLEGGFEAMEKTRRYTAALGY